MLAGCGEDSNELLNNSTLSVVSANLQKESNKGLNAATKLRSLVSPTTDDHIGVFLSGVGYTSLSNIDYGYIDATSWTTSTPIYVGKNNASVCAYYPYNASINNSGAVPLIAQLYSSSSDLYYCLNQTVNSTSTLTSSVSFSMVHAYAKMTFSITRDESFVATGNITKIALENPTIVGQTTLNIATSTYSGTPVATGSASASTNVTLPASGGGSSTVELLIPPTINVLTGNVDFYFTIDGEIIKTSLDALSNNLSTLSAGNNYLVSVTLRGKSLVVTNVNTTDWENTNVTNPVIGEPVNLIESNSYIVQPGGTVYIPVSRVVTAWTQINGSAYTLPATGTAGLFWTTSSNLLSPTGTVASIAYDKDAGYIKVKAGSAKGNSVIAFYDNDGTTIRWSWHIWVTDQPAFETVNGKVWMDRNLGATYVASNIDGNYFNYCGGLFYQWGRKDPFPGSDGSTTGNAPAMRIYNTSGLMNNASIVYSGFTTTATGTSNDVVKYASVVTPPLSIATQCATSVNYPLLFLKDWTGSTATSASDVYTSIGGISSWGGENGESKSIFDPCPAGWRVPSGKVSSTTLSSPWSTWITLPTFTTYTYVAVSWNSNLYRYPIAGSRISSSGYISQTGNSGTYWSASQSNNISGSMTLSSGSISTAVPGFLRSNGCSVRCVKE